MTYFNLSSHGIFIGFEMWLLPNARAGSAPRYLISSLLPIVPDRLDPLIAAAIPAVVLIVPELGARELQF